jgi:hypothetical protein
MAKTIPTKSERDGNLELLKKKVKEWADDEIKRLDNEAKFMRQVVKGRTGSEVVGQTNLIESSLLVQSEIDEFILFDG